MTTKTLPEVHANPKMNHFFSAKAVTIALVATAIVAALMAFIAYYVFASVFYTFYNRPLGSVFSLAGLIFFVIAFFVMWRAFRHVMCINRVTSLMPPPVYRLEPIGAYLDMPEPYKSRYEKALRTGGGLARERSDTVTEHAVQFHIPWTSLTMSAANENVWCLLMNLHRFDLHSRVAAHNAEVLELKGIFNTQLTLAA